MKFGEVKERILKEYSWAGESVGSSQLFMISSGVSILDNNESDNSKDRLLGTQSEFELGQSSDFYYRKIRQSGWDLYSQWIYVIIFMHLFLQSIINKSGTRSCDRSLKKQKENPCLI